MFAQFQIFADRLGLPVETLMTIGVGLGILLLFLGITALASERSVASIRVAAGPDRRQARLDRGLLRAPDAGPKGLMKTVIPSDALKRTELQHKLAQAGYPQAGALRNFMLVRAFLGVVVPSLFLGLIFWSKVPGAYLPLDILGSISKMTNMRIFQILSVLIAVGYYVPIVWLNGRVSERKQRIQEAFPNALDLMQISVEAGRRGDDPRWQRACRGLARYRLRVPQRAAPGPGRPPARDRDDGHGQAHRGRDRHLLRQRRAAIDAVRHLDVGCADHICKRNA